MEVIRIENINKSFGNKILFEDLNFSIDLGEMVAITGKSGCGKSTLLNILGLIEPFDSGIYTLFDQTNVPINSKQATQIIRDHINYLFQNFALIENESVENNLLIGLHYTKLNRIDKKRRIEDALMRVGLDGYAGIRVNQLSGGEQQRVAIARIMLKQGDLILADEPTGSLDEENREIILGLLKELNKEGKTIVIVTHDMYVACQCDRTIKL